ncbi:hypothetical protein B0H67DRAFT_595851 [Lasiosphaeris hirsuta]|uniref:DUF6594 domain-containing protein n=1 Tax=Lasiosphaeris hirsuta TaxID=260670 RepID=A0AA40DFN9_9PEZI|nr:hypothetical protein B0H67DRAFT_595851 [Lasiosphaeris hirsuta]
MSQTVPANKLNLRLEEYREGYPRLAAFLKLDRSFSVWKRFDYLHVRNLLSLQDELVELEERLNLLDNIEVVQLNLSSRRQDANQDRADLLAEIRLKIEQYDKSLLAYNQLICLPEPQARHRQSIAHWVYGNKPLVRSESACFLGSLQDNDFLTLSPPEDDHAILEEVLDWALKTFPRLSAMLSSSRDHTDDAKIFLYPPSLLRTIIRYFIAVLAPLWLAAHVLVLVSLPTGTGRTATFSIFILVTSFIITSTTRVSKYKLMLALLTYAAVPTVFLGNEAKSN